MSDNTVMKSVDDAETASAEEQGVALTLRTEVDQVIIIDQPTYESAAELLKTIKNQADKIEQERKKIKAPVLEAGKRIDGLFRDPLKACSMAEISLKGKISFYLQEQERKRQEAERKAYEEAQRIEEDSRIRRAIDAANAGRPEKEIKEIIDTPDPIEPLPVIPTVEKVAGIAQTETWHAELENFLTLIKAAAGGSSLARDCLSFNQVEANRKVKFYKEALQIPGIKAIKETGIAASRRG